jgi:hypothetical protein
METIQWGRVLDIDVRGFLHTWQLPQQVVSLAITTTSGVLGCASQALWLGSLSSRGGCQGLIQILMKPAGPGSRCLFGFAMRQKVSARGLEYRQKRRSQATHFIASLVFVVGPGHVHVHVYQDRIHIAVEDLSWWQVKRVHHVGCRRQVKLGHNSQLIIEGQAFMCRKGISQLPRPCTMAGSQEACL